MNKITQLSVIAAGIFLASCGSTRQTKDQDIKLETQEQKLSYAIGKDVGSNLRNNKIKVDSDIFLKGFRDAVNDTDGKAKYLMTDAEITSTFQEYQKSKMAEMQKQQEAEASRYRAEGEQFLTNNRSKAGIKETASGLQYEVIKEGSGAKPTGNSTVKVHYTGTLLDGTVFDSSVQRGEPAQFPLNGVIKGWTEGLQLMNKGSKYKLYIPADLAYGNQGAGELIKPGMTLIFEVELLDIVK